MPDISRAHDACGIAEWTRRSITFVPLVSLLLADQHDQPLSAGDARVKQITLQHGVMLRQQWNDDGGIFRALALVDGYGVSRHQGVELTEAVGDGTAVEAGSKLAIIGVDIHDIAESPL
jgi:hypothetical protein